MNQKVNLIKRGIFEYFNKPQCPYCNSSEAIQIDQKALVMRLMECTSCQLRFRYPTDDVAFNNKFYQEAYEQEGGFTTDLPSAEELRHLKDTNFKDSEKSIERIDRVLSLLIQKNPEQGLSKNILDYGASWGYMSYQFYKSGYDLQSFEISKPRANFGIENLGVDIKTDERELVPGISFFFSSHVIEHHPDIKGMITLSKKLLNSSGFFIAYSPNGSDEFKLAQPEGFHKFWGVVHPNLLSAAFYKKIFKDNPYFITSTPVGFNQLEEWDGHSQQLGDLSRGELLVISRPNITL